MIFLIHLLVLIPLIGFIISLLLPKSNERLISSVSIGIVTVELVVSWIALGFWLFNGGQELNLKELVIYASPDYEFFLDVFFDKITATYLFVGTLLVFLITIYCRYYLHRESGYKRFFNTILLFYWGYIVVVFAGNFETLFVGWEVLGISSFLLIAFYRERFMPVENALKVFSIYRISDVGIILAMWMSHHLWHSNTTFITMENWELVHHHLEEHSWIGIFISLMLLIAASAKSALFPFSFWLPRAMEGPTPSSAIFYGSLSAHMGVFLLLRTAHFWEQQISIRVIIIILGLLTTVMATFSARVQSSVKSQIAYASISQIGLMFIEVALGFHTLALIHFAGNAFLRTYQLLVSPSVASYLIREQFYHFTPHQDTLEDTFPKKIEYTLYMWSLKEFGLDRLLYLTLWRPLKVIGDTLHFFNLKTVIFVFVPLYSAGLSALYFEWIPEAYHRYCALVFAGIALLMVLVSFAERKDPLLAWVLIVMNHFWVALAVAYNSHFSYSEVHLYLSGVAIAGLVGLYSLYQTQKKEPTVDLSRYHGHGYEYPKASLVVLISCLAVSGFPITPTFIGEDLIFSHIGEHHYLLAFMVALCFIIDGLSLVRIYARIFLGPHIKTYHETPYKSS